LAVIALVALCSVTGGQGASAKAPALATTVLPVDLRAAPAYDAATVAGVSEGIELELTGDAAPGFLAVYLDGQTLWVPAQYLAVGDRPGIDTAVTSQDTPLLDAPMRDAAVLQIIPNSEAVILTGASVDGYDAAAHDGAGGWVDARDLAR
jgi:hypothetical protein